MNAPSVLLLDYGSGNLRSAQRALEKVGADVAVSADFDAAMAADGLLVPGVGAYGACMKGIREVRGDMLVDRRLSGGRPVMGICVGMQVMFDQGVEHAVETEGLGQWPGVIEELQAPILPHMGWNTVRVAQDSTLFEGVKGERFYFVHSYAARRWDFVARDENQNSPEVTWSHHGEDFVAAVENGPLVATQFHPEKSGDAGLHLLENWVKSLR